MFEERVGLECGSGVLFRYLNLFGERRVWNLVFSLEFRICFG